MKKYLTLAASALLLAACSEKPGYEINGTVANTDLNGKYVYLYEYGVQDAAPMDSALVQNGTFTFKGTQNAPALRKLAFAEDVVEPKRAASGENAPLQAYSYWRTVNYRLFLTRPLPPFLEHRRMTD